MRWITLIAIFIVAGCGGSDKKSGAKIAGSVNSGNGSAGGSSSLVTATVDLFDINELAGVVPDIARRMNAYEVSFVHAGDTCADQDQTIVGNLNEHLSVEVDLPRGCDFTATLSYGNSLDLAGAAPIPAVPDPATPPAGASLVAYNGVGGAKEYLDMKCVLCHGAESFPRVDLSTYEVAKLSAEDQNGLSILDFMKPLDPANIMPPGAPDPDGVKIIEDWAANGHAENAAAGLSLTATVAQAYYVSSVPIQLSKQVLGAYQTLSLKFKLDVTPEGIAIGLSTPAVASIQGKNYRRADSVGTTRPAPGGVPATPGDSAVVIDDPADPVDDAVAVDPEDPNRVPADLNFDDISALFLDPAVGNCAAAGCHDGASPPRIALIDYESIKAGAELSIDYLKLTPDNPSMMPKGGTPYTAEQILMISDWVAGEFKEGAPPAPVVALSFAADIEPLVGAAGKGSCAMAGCHVAGGPAPVLLGLAAFTAGAAASVNRVKNFAGNNLTIMPPQNTINAMAAEALNAADIQLIEAWIAGGMLP